MAHIEKSKSFKLITHFIPFLSCLESVRLHWRKFKFIINKKVFKEFYTLLKHQRIREKGLHIYFGKKKRKT